MQLTNSESKKLSGPKKPKLIDRQKTTALFRPLTDKTKRLVKVFENSVGTRDFEKIPALEEEGAFDSIEKAAKNPLFMEFLTTLMMKTVDAEAPDALQQRKFWSEEFFPTYFAENNDIVSKVAGVKDPNQPADENYRKAYKCLEKLSKPDNIKFLQEFLERVFLQGKKPANEGASTENSIFRNPSGELSAGNLVNKKILPIYTSKGWNQYLTELETNVANRDLNIFVNTVVDQIGLIPSITDGTEHDVMKNDKVKELMLAMHKKFAGYLGLNLLSHKLAGIGYKVTAAAYSYFLERKGSDARFKIAYIGEKAV